MFQASVLMQQSISPYQTKKKNKTILLLGHLGNDTAIVASNLKKVEKRNINNKLVEKSLQLTEMHTVSERKHGGREDGVSHCLCVTPCGAF